MKIPQATYDVIWDALNVYLFEAECSGNSTLIQEIEIAYEVIESIGTY